AAVMIDVVQDRCAIDGIRNGVAHVYVVERKLLAVHHANRETQTHAAYDSHARQGAVFRQSPRTSVKVRVDLVCLKANEFGRRRGLGLENNLPQMWGATPVVW